MAALAPPPQLPLAIRRHGLEPLQAQIADQIRQLVEKGILAPSSRVPSTRALSEQLGVSRNTVTLAYDLLIAEGILEVESSAGTMVSRQPPAAFCRVTTSSRGAGEEPTPEGRTPARRVPGARPRVHDPLAGRLRLRLPDGAAGPGAVSGRPSGTGSSSTA